MLCTRWDIERHYTGDDYIDWIRVSYDAAHTLEPLVRLGEILDPAINQIHRFSPGVVNGTKPIAIAELGAIDHPPQDGQLSKAQWIDDPCRLLAADSNEHGLYRDQIRAVNWWDEPWWDESGSTPFLANNSIASSPQSVDACRTAIAGSVFAASAPS